jgi:hypothetical protein
MTEETKKDDGKEAKKEEVKLNRDDALKAIEAKLVELKVSAADAATSIGGIEKLLGDTTDIRIAEKNIDVIANAVKTSIDKKDSSFAIVGAVSIVTFGLDAAKAQTAIEGITTKANEGITDTVEIKKTEDIVATATKEADAALKKSNKVAFSVVNKNTIVGVVLASIGLFMGRGQAKDEEGKETEEKASWFSLKGMAKIAMIVGGAALVIASIKGKDPIGAMTAKFGKKEPTAVSVGGPG